MPSLEEHERDTIEKLGKPFTEVHEFLDKHIRTIGGRHRHALHHREGIEEVRRRFGDDAARAAECHIRLDCMGRVPAKADYSTWIRPFRPRGGWRVRSSRRSRTG